MTATYESLKKQPQSKVDRGSLHFDERSQLRVIEISGNRGRTKSSPGRFTSIYYLSGDEKRASERFVEENEEHLQKVDFTKNRNLVQANVCREIYDYILHHLGERCLRRFDTVVVEERSDGCTWTINREHFDKDTARRYTISDQVAAQICGETLQSIYEQFGTTITESDLRNLKGAKGDVRFILDAYRSAPEFECNPISLDGELAILKIEHVK